MGSIARRATLHAALCLVLCSVTLPAVANAAFPGQNGRIAFMSWQQPTFDNSEIWVMDGVGGSSVRLTDNAVADVYPASSPDGQKVAFTTERDGNNEIYVMNSDGTSPTNLTNHAASDFDPQFSADGRQIAFVSGRDGNFEVYVMDADGSNQTRLTNDPGNDTQPAFSPDGQRIAFTRAATGSYSEVYVMGADGTNPTNLTNDPLGDHSPDFSPDGQRILFTTSRSSGPEHIYVMDADGSDQTAVTSTSASDAYPAFSPDGKKIAFSRAVSSQYDIYVMDADGANPTNLTNSLVQDTYPSWGVAGTAPPTPTDPGPPSGTPGPPGTPGVSINDGARFTNTPQVSIRAVWPPQADTMLISNDGGFTNPGVFPVATSTPWVLDSSGQERLPRTVYVRFTGGQAGRETYQDDIILDETLPQVSSASIRIGKPVSAATHTRAKRTYRLTVRARDTTSGLARMQVTSTKSKPGKLRKFRQVSTFTSRTNRIYVRVRDQAGNFSRWKRALRR